eukprot:32725-Chlamydomonas_euryale.AAC.23
MTCMDSCHIEPCTCQPAPSCPSKLPQAIMSSTYITARQNSCRRRHVQTNCKPATATVSWTARQMHAAQHSPLRAAHAISQTQGL